MSTGREITLAEEDDGWWSAVDEATGVASQGPSREAALENLDEALDGYHGEGDAPSDEELLEVGIDPADNTSGSLEDSEVFE
jgi:predicted RNase H-like HicB family nuclease